jgi:hypothetical protein
MNIHRLSGARRRFRELAFITASWTQSFPVTPSAYGLPLCGLQRQPSKPEFDGPQTAPPEIATRAMEWFLR